MGSCTNTASRYQCLLHSYSIRPTICQLKCILQDDLGRGVKFKNYTEWNVIGTKLIREFVLIFNRMSCCVGVQILKTKLTQNWNYDVLIVSILDKILAYL